MPESPRRRRASGEVSAATTSLRARATAEDAALSARTSPVWWFPRTVVDVVRKADRDRLLGTAAESAFFSVLTLFPALLFAAAIVGQLGAIVGQDAASRVEDAVLTFLDRVLTDAARPVVGTVQSLFEGSGNLLTLATVLALGSLSTAFATLINTLNIAYEVPETRGWWYRRWLGLLLGVGSVVTGAVTVTLLVIGPLLGRGNDLGARIGLDVADASVWQTLRWPVAFAALVLWATTVQHLTPALRHKWRHDLPGGLLTAILWLAASAGLNVYLTAVVPASPLLGALGGGLILMAWFYLLCVALLAGASLNAVLAARRRYRGTVQRRSVDGRAEDVTGPMARPSRGAVPPVDAAQPAAPPAPPADSRPDDEADQDAPHDRPSRRRRSPVVVRRAE
ncbi:MAG TPA: YihY/virulence factor BrkB family protein [Mycobacteriales bacterium]|nr:YihY/virulence factor BrkB family protein [Mycobacteriales bacterium]